MSKTEGNVGGRSTVSIEEPSEAEKEAIREQIAEVVTARTGTLHPCNEDGEPLCKDTNNQGGEARWSKPRPLAAFPPGYAPFCSHCVRNWRTAYTDRDPITGRVE